MGGLALAQSDEVGVCKPVSARTGEFGCWIVAQQPLGEFAANHAGGAQNENMQDPTPFFLETLDAGLRAHSFTAPVMADT